MSAGNTYITFIIYVSRLGESRRHIWVTFSL